MTIFLLDMTWGGKLKDEQMSEHLCLFQEEMGEGELRQRELWPRANPVLTAGHSCPDLRHGAPGSPTGRKNLAMAPA